jgi:hypothetical protein
MVLMEKLDIIKLDKELFSITGFRFWDNQRKTIYEPIPCIDGKRVRITIEEVRE